jgi:hypothetical protein
MARQCARAALAGQQAGLGLDLVQVLGDGQGVPHRHALVAQAGHQDGGRQQQHLGLHGGVVGADQHLAELQAASRHSSQPRRDQDE